MNKARYMLGGLSVFGFIFVFEWIFHGMLLKGLYAQSPGVWRPEAEMMARFHFLFIGQLIFSFVFAYIFLKGYQNRGTAEGVRYGLLIGLLIAPMHLGMYAVSPVPLQLVIAWIVGSLVEYILAGTVLAAVYKSNKPAM